MATVLDLGKYPEYGYPFSYKGELEGRIDDFAKEGGSRDVSDVLRMLDPRLQIEDCGKRLNSTFFREYYPRPGLRSLFETHWAGEEAKACHGYPSQKAPGVQLGEVFACRYGEPLLRGSPPTWSEPQEYHCPYGWRRFSFEVPDFKKCDTYAVAYHGTSLEKVPGILARVLEPGEAQEGGDGHCTYLSPSIEYAACPRYAKPVLLYDRHVQCVIQFRVARPSFVQAETLGPTFHPRCPGGWASRAWGFQTGGKGLPYPEQHLVFDPHFRNEELEWLYSDAKQDLRETLVPIGLMIRVLKTDPAELLQWRQEAARATTTTTTTATTTTTTATGPSTWCIIRRN